MVDCTTDLTVIEIKSGQTIQPDFFRGLRYFSQLAPQTSPYLIYGGTEAQRRTDARVLTIEELGELSTK